MVWSFMTSVLEPDTFFLIVKTYTHFFITEYHDEFSKIVVTPRTFIINDTILQGLP